MTDDPHRTPPDPDSTGGTARATSPRAARFGSGLARRVVHAFICRQDRVRGSGWLDCPNCHEHAVQDVVDEMTFACLLWVYRLSPVRRARVLLCRRCGFRRPATGTEMAALDTAGEPIRPAWLVPVGATPIVLALILATIFVNHTGASSEGITYIGSDCGSITACKFETPTTYEVDTTPDGMPPKVIVSDRARPFRITLLRYDDGSSPLTLFAGHFTDDAGINSVCVPSTPPATHTTTVAGQTATVGVVYWSDNGEAVQEVVYAFKHDGVDYLLTVHSAGRATIPAEKDIRDHFLATFHFTGGEPSPSATAGESPGASASPGGSPGAGASPGPSASPGASASSGASASPGGSPGASPGAGASTSSSSEETSSSAGGQCDFLRQVEAENPQ